MADRSVVARDESHVSEASQALMFCFDRKVLLCRRFCVPECHQKELKSSTAEKVFFFFFRFRGRLSGKTDEGK